MSDSRKHLHFLFDATTLCGEDREKVDHNNLIEVPYPVCLACSEVLSRRMEKAVQEDWTKESEEKD